MRCGWRSRRPPRSPRASPTTWCSPPTRWSRSGAGSCPRSRMKRRCASAWRLLSGRRHRVLTGVALALPGGGTRSRLVETMIAMKRLSAEEIDYYAAPRRMARQGRRLCAARLWRSLCPPHRRQLFQRRRPAAGRDPPPAQERGFSTLPEWLDRARHRRDPGRAGRGRRDRRGADPARRRGPRRDGARRAARSATGRNAVARAGGEEYLLPKGAPGVTEGAALAIEVTREAPGRRRAVEAPAGASHRCRARPRARRSRPDLAFPSPTDALEAAGWSDLLDEARSGIVAFPGGELRVSLTPAMTLIDVDGHLPPEQLALAGAQAAARAIRRHGIGGSIGIDLPTIGGKAARQAVAEAVDAILPAAVRAHRGQRLRLPPDRPPAPPRQPVRARRRPRRRSRRAPCSAAPRARPAPITLVAHPAVHRRAQARMARPARGAGRRRGDLASRADTRHVGGLCPTLLKNARCAASRRARPRALLQPRLQGSRPA